MPVSKQRVRDLVEQGDRLFSQRSPLLDLWQVMAEQFCPIRADFTTKHYLGKEFASHLMTGRPVLAHRDLGNALSSMLRPRGQAWFKARTGDDKINNDAAARQWLDGKSDVMRNIMYDQRAQFVRATKQGDHDFVAFGQTVISVDPNSNRDGLLFRTWHLRDVVWCENAELQIDTVHRNWSLEARSLAKLFPKTVDAKVTKATRDEPYRDFKCRHIVIPADEYDLPESAERRGKKLPFVSIYVDCENDTILEEVGSRRVNYVIPRWQTVSGSPYAHSPATVVALPDARLLQQMTLTLLEAGQKAVDPPLKATREAVLGGVNIHAGATTSIDADYDERTGAALEPLYDTGKANLSWGEHREEKVERLISEAFFLNVINLPEAAQGDKMTAYETEQRVREYIRRALPLFEPMEVEYNGGLCEITFQLAMEHGAFGSMEDMPGILRGREINWQFESPLQAANDRVKFEAFNQSAMLLKQAAEIDPSTRFDIDISTAFRSALSGVAPADWIVPEDKAAAAKAQDAQVQQARMAAEAVAAGAGVATQVGEAGQALGGAQAALKEAGMVQ